MRVLLAIPLVLMLVPEWSGDERLALPRASSQITAERVPLHPGDRAVRRVGALTFLGGVALSSPDPAFGGFSALLVDGDRFSLLGDGGNLLRFRMSGDWRPSRARLDPLPSGPGTGWRKADRDSESAAVDPLTGRAWVGFERHNQIWRYSPGFARAERFARPAAMAGWPENGGPECMTRLRDGSFVVISEQARHRFKRKPKGWRLRAGLIFRGDPTMPGVAAEPFGYRTSLGFSPVAMAELPDGRLLILERGFEPPYRWKTRLVLAPRESLRAGGVVQGRMVAELAPPLLSDNFEALAVTREGGATIVWLASDDNQSILQRSLLLKFRLDWIEKGPPS